MGTSRTTYETIVKLAIAVVLLMVINWLLFIPLVVSIGHVIIRLWPILIRVEIGSVVVAIMCLLLLMSLSRRWHGIIIQLLVKKVLIQIIDIIVIT